MNEDSFKGRKILSDEFITDRCDKLENQTKIRKYGSPKNTFERNYNKLYREFNSRDYNNSLKIKTRVSPKFKNSSAVSSESGAKLNLKALQSQIETRSKSNKNLKTKFKEMKINYLTQNLLQTKSSKSGGYFQKEPSHHRLHSASSTPISSKTSKIISKTENKLISNDFISDKMKMKLIDVYKKANQSGILERDLSSKSLALLTEMMPLSVCPNLNFSRILNGMTATTPSNSHRSKINFFIQDFIESSPNRVKVKLVQREITSMWNGANSKENGVISKIRSICDDHPRSGLKGDYKTFLNFGNFSYLI